MIEGTKKEALTDKQFDHVPLIFFKSQIPKKANRVPGKKRMEFSKLEEIQSTVENVHQQVTPGDELEVVKDLMVNDEVDVERKVNLEVISSEYGGDLLELLFILFVVFEVKNGDEKVDNDVKKDGKEYVKSVEEEQPQVAEKEDSEQQTLVVYYNGKKDVQYANDVFAEEEKTMVVVEVAKIDIIVFNQEEVIGESYQASADQITVISIKEQTMEVTKTEDEASQAINAYSKALIHYFNAQHRDCPVKEKIVLVDVYSY
ncbi:hypothetical protein GIB67_006646 [Kingdonia uniflora]|uniref:Uncharacterized protein n=1 Tax=Kingdonia uniflora TaxID=39325 RepID=A0A7J7L0V8_9MAGN|nr:hypothetical protein GIB67_006646 [Kingdonia uniflora]